jgi:enoyl-CoA hydratase/carnithine racemase
MDRLLFIQEDKIGYLTLNRTHKYNAVDSRMLAAWRPAFK